ncbi:MAG: Ig domain-containing protein [Terriglobales bacterium]
MWRWVLVLLLASSAAAQSTDPTRLDFVTKSLPVATIGRTYTTTIKLQGGKGPFQWTVTKGTLPPGIRLQADTGVLNGTPTQTGVFRFIVNVLDQGTNAKISREFTIEVQGPLLLEWVDLPKLNENTVSGRIKVTNSSTRGDAFDLTVIIVAVNEIGKAFALGYQHFQLAHNVEQVIPFSSTLPNGQYIVHVDAIAEVPARRAIFRARLQRQSPIVVNVNR